MTGTLTTAARRVLLLAIDAHRDDPETARGLHAQLVRLDEPLRVAIAGKVKAGKSTLLNALVGEQVAPTDAGECTRVVTWYRDGPTPRILLHPTEGEPTPLPVRRPDGALAIDLGGTPAERVDRLTVDWPSQSLRLATLIDTPGIASTTAENSRRTVAFLDPDDDTPTEADAVIYLMRHLHAADAQFLESFRDRGVARAGAVNTIAVISRADEIGGGRVDAMFAARGIAQRYRSDPTVRGLCQNVVAVAGLIAETGRTLRQSEFAALAELAGQPKAELESQLRSVDRFSCAGRPGRAAAAVGALRHLRHPAVHQPDPAGREQPGRAGHRAGRAQRPRRAAAGAALAVQRAARAAQGPFGAARGGPCAAHHPPRRTAAAGDRQDPGRRARAGRAAAARHTAVRAGRAAERRRPPRPNGCSATPARPRRPGSGWPPRQPVSSCARRPSRCWTAGSGTP